MRLCFLTAVTFFALIAAQTLSAQEAASPAKPTEHIVGTISSADAAGQTVTVKEDSNGMEHVIQLQNTKTLLKVAPGAKDLKSASRISAADLAAGDRVDVRGSKVEAMPNAIAARSVVLMSARELQQAHQEEASAWQHSIAGTVTAIDPSNQKITIKMRGADAAVSTVVNTTNASFTRYSPEHPKNANLSRLGDVQPGDQIRIIGEKSGDGATITAQKIYSGSFKTVAGTVVSVAADGKTMVVKDLSTKQTTTVSLSEESNIHKLPPMMAMMLARRFNPDMKTAAAGPGGAPAQGGGTPQYGAKAGESNPGTAPGATPPQRNPDAAAGGPGGRGGPGVGGGPGFGSGRMGNGDLSQMLERLPKITVSDLKAGDAVIVSGSPSATERTTLLATSVIAGVEPIFQSASPKQAQSLGDWGSSLGGGAAMDTGAPPQ